MKFSFILRNFEITSPWVVNIEFVPEINYVARILENIFLLEPLLSDDTLDFEECFYRNLEDFIVCDLLTSFSTKSFSFLIEFFLRVNLVPRPKLIILF